MVRKLFVVTCVVAAWSIGLISPPVLAQVVAPSTWGAGIVIDPQPRDVNGVPEPATESAFDDWNDIPLAVTDPADNPSVFNIIDIMDVKIANDADFIYIYVSGHTPRTNGMYLAFDADQDLATGFDIYGLGLVGSEIGYVNDFVFDQRTPGVFNNNQPDPGGSCCTGGPLDLNNGGAAMYPAWDVEFGEREWGIPLDAMWSEVEPFGPTFPNPTFNFIVWTDQGLSDVTDVITYTLATPPSVSGDYNGDGTVNAADYTIWRDTLGSTTDLRANGDNTGVSENVIDQADYNFWTSQFGTGASALSTAVPEPSAVSLLVAASAVIGVVWRRRCSSSSCSK